MAVHKICIRRLHRAFSNHDKLRLPILEEDDLRTDLYRHFCFATLPPDHLLSSRFYD